MAVIGGVTGSGGTLIPTGISPHRQIDLGALMAAYLGNNMYGVAAQLGAQMRRLPNGRPVVVDSGGVPIDLQKLLVTLRREGAKPSYPSAWV